MTQRTALPPRSAIASLMVAFAVGAATEAFGWWAIREPLGIALWAVVASVLLLPLAIEADEEGARPDHVAPLGYAVAVLPMALGTWHWSGVEAAVVVAVVGWSLAGMLLLLTTLHVPAVVACAVLIAQGGLFLSWPIWASSVLVRHDVQPLVDLLVNVGPLFAINGAVAPGDPFTHRPLAYQLMNLGQDVPFTMPRSVWPCVITHLIVGVPGVVILLKRRIGSSARARSLA